MTKYIAFAVSFAMGLLVATSMSTASAEADPSLSCVECTVVSAQSTARDTAECPCRGS